MDAEDSTTKSGAGENVPPAQSDSSNEKENNAMSSQGQDAKKSEDNPETEIFDPRPVCDRCDQRISGARHKCQDCPDFDYCSRCFPNASTIHPGHSFVQLEVPVPDGILQDTSKDEEDGPSSNWELVEQTTFSVSSPSKCKSCAPITEPLSGVHLLLKDPKVPRQLSLRWIARVSQLIEATQSGCAFCCFFLDKIFGPSNAQIFAYHPKKPWYAEPSKHDEKREHLVEHCMQSLTRLKSDRFEFAVTPLCTKKGSTMPDFDRLSIALAKSNEKRHNMKELRGVFNSAGNIEIEMDVFAASNNPAAAFLSSRPPNPRPGSPEAMAQIKAWLATCDEHHGGACRPSSESRLPARVIDVSGPEVLRLHESDIREHGHYTTLSYCWGGTQDFRTTSSTLADRMAGFSYQELPQTLQDAVKITRELGVRYLWVDSMCIIQDNEEDKAHQVSNMVEIYKNAYLTICAASADNTSKGFLGDHADPDTGLWKSLIPMVYPIPNKDALTIQDAFKMPRQDIGTVWLMDENYKFSRTIADGSVEKRGWCLQEKILSPRFLSYGRWPTWRCNREVWSDGGVYPEDAKKTSEVSRLVNSFLHLPDNSADLFTINQLQNSWYSLVNNYTKRELGLHEDRLPAIGGIAAQISRISGVEYVAGLWKNNLLHDMMWYADCRDWLTRPPRWRAPSWSWASVDCPVSYGDITTDATPLARVTGYQVVAAPQNSSFGQVSSGFLEIEGPFAEIDRQDVLKLLRSQDLAPPPPSSNDVSDWYQQMMEHIANQPKNKVSLEDAEAGLPDKVYGLITFTRDWTKRYEHKTETTCYFGLLLREVADKKYERIGAFFNENADWVDQDAKQWAKSSIIMV